MNAVTSNCVQAGKLDKHIMGPSYYHQSTKQSDPMLCGSGGGSGSCHETMGFIEVVNGPKTTKISY